MRNLLEYPITNEEIIACLQTLAAEINNENRIGDMRPMLLTEAAQIIGKAAGSYAVIRTDDNGNVFTIQSGLSQAAADRLCAEMTRRGHKQTYEIRNEASMGLRNVDDLG